MPFLATGESTETGAAMIWLACLGFGAGGLVVGVKKFAHYLWRALYHEGLKARTKRRQGKPLESSRLRYADYLATEPPPDEQAASSEFFAAAARAIAALPEKQRVVARARLLEGKSNDEAARLVGLSAGQASRIYGQALSRLIRALEAFSPDKA
jgi:RNA polymerase sigma-70 factor (ECF subfamily)